MKKNPDPGTMSEARCLYCYQQLPPAAADFHPGCSRKIFGRRVPPRLEYTEDQMLELAEKVIKSQVTVTGVQPKLSLSITQTGTSEVKEKFTIVGLWGDYILKPPVRQYPDLPELEDLTMHLASIAGIATVPHSLIRLQSGKLAYITRRVDRTREGKLPMEDMCQLTERLTEDKYKGSYEQIGKAILKYSASPVLDTTVFFQQVIFSFLTGNADMHLKNFSLLYQPGLGHTLCPAYDMVASALVVPEDEEELALTLNGKKKKLGRQDFAAAMERSQIEPRAVENVFRGFQRVLPGWQAFIENSFLPENLKVRYQELIRDKARQIELT